MDGMRNHMWRAFAAALLIGCLLPCLYCKAAKEDFYCEYTPKTATGTVFYVDIYCQREVSAAVLELSFDSGIVEYRSVAAAQASSSVRGNCEDGSVRLAFADSGAVRGQLCRVSFKALRAGTCRFTLHPVQAADGTLGYIAGLEDDTLTVKLGKDDVSGVLSSSSRQTSSAAASYGDGKSYLDTGDGDDSNAYGAGDVIDIRNSRAWIYMLIGAGAVILPAALVLIGVLIGRKSKEKESKTDPDDGTPPPS